VVDSIALYYDTKGTSYLEVTMNNVYDDLGRAFKDELHKLSLKMVSAIVDDFRSAQCSATEYARRIGRGNLRSYADVLASSSRER
jgi:hypothetical protein